MSFRGISQQAHKIDDETNNEAEFPEFLEDCTDDLKSSNDLDKPSFRSAAVVRGALQLQSFGVGERSFDPEAAGLLNGLKISESIAGKNKQEVHEKIICPGKPFLLMKTHFFMEALDYRSFLDLMADINENLRTVENYDFSYCKQDVMWKGKYIKGSTSCEIHVHVYSEKIPTKYIVEAHRVKGDSKPFFAFYRAFKSAITGETFLSHCEPVFRAELSSSKRTDEQFMSGVDLIVELSKSSFYEEKLEAAKMLCDISNEPEQFLCLEKCRERCVECLEHLVKEADFDCIREHALLAAALLCKVSGYKELMVQSTLLAAIFGFVSPVSPDEPLHETAQLRRECAYLLNELAQHNCVALLRTLFHRGIILDLASLGHWLKNIDFIADPICRERGENVKKLFEETIANAKTTDSSTNSVTSVFQNA